MADQSTVHYYPVYIMSPSPQLTKITNKLHNERHHIFRIHPSLAEDLGVWLNAAQAALTV